MIIRLNNHAEPIEKLITDLENGSRELSPAQTSCILRQMYDAIKAAPVYAIAGYGYVGKESRELNLVKNPKQYDLPHVFALYRIKD